MFNDMTYGDFTNKLFNMGNCESMGYGLASQIFSYRNTVEKQYNSGKVELAKATLENDYYAMDVAMHRIQRLKNQLDVYNELLEIVNHYMEMDEENA